MNSAVRAALLVGISAGLGVGAASADTIGSVSSAAALGANDQVSWSQFSGSNIGGYFTAVSTNGYAVNGAFANAEQYQSANAFSMLGTSNAATLMTYNTASALVGGPVTFSLPLGSNGVGTTIGDPAAARKQAQFTVSLTLFSGATQIGSVSGTSDSKGDPFFLGALDSTGQNITSFTYSVTSIGTLTNQVQGAQWSNPSAALISNIDYNSVDAYSCISVPQSAYTGPNSLQYLARCPIHYSYYTGQTSGFLSAADYATLESYSPVQALLVNTYTSSVDTRDTRPADLQSFSLTALQLKIPGTATVRATANACVATKPTR